MIPYQKEKIENAICYFAREHKKRTMENLYQTFLYKYLAFLDFECLRETGRPALGLVYRAWERGPVPIEIYEKREKYQTPLFAFVKGERGNTYFIVSKQKPNLDYFSKYELDLMGKLIEIYACSYVYSHHISDASHERILAWQKTWKRKPNDIIDPALTFDDHLLEKPDDELSYPEESYLIYMALR